MTDHEDMIRETAKHAYEIFRKEFVLAHFAEWEDLPPGTQVKWHHIVRETLEHRARNPND